MSEHRYQLSIVGTVWTVLYPFELEIGEACKPFVSKCISSDYEFCFRIGESNYGDEILIRNKAPRVWKGNDYIRVERNIVADIPRSTVILSEKKSNYTECLIHPDYVQQFKKIDEVLGLLEMETHLARLSTVNLHSSLIFHDEEAILFTAPSGTGKSTQANLWEQYRNARQINGDRSLIRKIHGQWTAFGSPFAGTSGIYRNESAPIKAIVILRQGKENHVKWISPSAAFRYLYQETVIPRWNDKAHIQIMDILNAMVEDLPICCFQCTPDESAVEVLDRFLQEEQYDR